MAIEVREGTCSSWLDADYSKLLARRLAAKLHERCQGLRGIVLTLTYRHDDWSTPVELWRAQSERMHLPLFVRRIQRHIGRDLSGQWFGKVEFQRGGWIHFHVIILGVDRIEHAALTTMWGHGHVWVNRLTPKRVRYVAKYLAKGAQLPAFLYAEKYVKIIRASRGWWGRGKRWRDDSKPSPLREGDEGEDADGTKWRVRTPPLPQRVPWYIPLGERIRRAKHKTKCRDEQGRHFQVKATMLQLVQSLRAARVRVGAGCRGWLRLNTSRERVERAAAEPRSGPPPLHLIPDRFLDVGDRGFWRWFDLVMEERLSWT